MAILENFEERREAERKHSVAPEHQTLQGCHLKRIRGPRSVKGNFYVWLVDSFNYDTSLYSKRTFQEESMRNGMKCVKGDGKDQDGKDQGIYRQEAGRYGTYSDLETTKNTRLGMNLFKDIHPALPLEQQINTKYKDPLFDEYAIVSTIVEGGIDVWPKEATKVQEENENAESIPEVKTEIPPKQEPEHYELTEKNRAFFERDQISHNERPILSDRQKEIMLAHLFDKKVLVIDGGPGTGKSTTMIQRLKLFLSNEFYSDKEYANFNFKHGTNWNLLQTIYSDFLKQELEKKENNKLWMFFSPTSQLNSFLRSSLEKEGLQYSEQSTKTWLEKDSSEYEGYCLVLGRDSYKFSRNIPIDTRSNANLNINPQQDYKAFERILLNILNNKFSGTCESILQKAEQANISKNDVKDLSAPFASIDSLFSKNTEKFHTKEIVSNRLEKFSQRIIEKINNVILKETGSIENDENIFWTICFLKLRNNNTILYKEAITSTQQNDSLNFEKILEKLFSLIGGAYIGKDTPLLGYLLGLPSLPEENDIEATIKSINNLKTYLNNNNELDALKDLKFLSGNDSDTIQKTTHFYKKLFKSFINKVVEYYVTNKGLLNDYGLYNFIKSDIEQEWFTIQEIETLYAKALSNETKKLFEEYIQDAYENIYRKEQFHYEFSDRLQFQEISFLIYAGNKLAQKLYKLCRAEFDSILARPKDPTHYDIIGGYNKAWRIVIGIDEATDFVPIELAAMASLQHPQYGCVTLSGDQMQCFNNDGIKDWKQLEKDIFDFGSDIISLDISYRQTPSLLNMAKKIYRRTTGKEAPYNAYISSYENEPQPLLFKSDDDDEKKTWIAKRIIAMAKKNRLPATAIFYPINDENSIEKFTKQLNDIIYEKGGDFTIASCFSKRSEGKKVVVYPLNLVKGLEFEAAFFFNLDQIADPTMQERFLYVGLSRATFYLGATSSSNWDTELSKDFEQDLSKSNWPCLESEKPAPPPKDNNVPPPAPKNEVPSAKTVVSSQNIVTQSSASIQPAIRPSNPQFISPLDWAKKHNEDVHTVIKLLRESNPHDIGPLTKVSVTHYSTMLDRIKREKEKPEINKKIAALTKFSTYDPKEQIKPIDWANAHGISVEVVMRLLRYAGVTVRTQLSKVDASDYKQIEADAEAERRKIEERAKRSSLPRSVPTTLKENSQNSGGQKPNSNAEDMRRKPDIARLKAKFHKL